MDRVKTIINNFKKIFKTSTEAEEGSRSFLYNERKFYYKIQPFYNYIENNIDLLLYKSVLWFRKYKIKPKIGIEIEFFSDYDFEKMNISDFCTKNYINIEGFERERADKQYEIKFACYTNVKKLINDYNKLKSFLIDNFDCNFNSIIDKNEVGSALQVNLSLFKDKKNIFLEDDKNMLLNSIAGILSTTNMFINFYAKDLYRYDKKNNEILYSNGKIPAPSFISWGYNNRTCALRVPDSKVLINDLKKYREEIENTRRIEFRVPASDSDIKFVLYCVLNSVIYGIENNLKPPKDTYNNAFKNNEDLIEIAKNEYTFNEFYEIVKTILE